MLCCAPSLGTARSLQRRDAQKSNSAQRRVSSRRATPATASSSYYGVSGEDGTWFPQQADGFQKMLRAAKGFRDVVQAGTPALREAAKPIAPEEIGSSAIQDLIEEMTQVMLVRGVGLAAPQLGVPLQLIVLADTEEGISDLAPGEAEAQERKPFKLKVIINPVVEPRPGAGSAFFFEGCLSVQGYRGLVERALEVSVSGYGGDGKRVQFVARGWEARILQHEADHLKGTLYVDRMVPRTFRRVDLVAQPLPPPHPEFGTCPPLGVAAREGNRAGGASGKGFGGGGMAGAVVRREGSKGGFGKKK